MNEKPKITTYNAVRQLILDSVTAGTLTQGLAELYLSRLLNASEDDQWMLREKVRMLNGDYRRLPDSILQYELGTGLRVESSPIGIPHYIHLSQTEDDDPSTVMVAYTPNADMGRADRQLRTRFTRFLMKYHGVHENEAAAINHRLRAVLELDKNKTEQIKNDIVGEETLQAQLLRDYNIEMLTGTDIVAAYEECYNGLTASCMTYPWDRWRYYDEQGEKIHPASAYAFQPEMAMLVYRSMPDNKIAGRVMVHLPTKTYQRIYGQYNETQLLMGALTKHGFVNRTWNNIWLPAVKVANGDPGFIQPDPGIEHYLMPWTDGDCNQAWLDTTNNRFVLVNASTYNSMPYTERGKRLFVGTHNNPSHIVRVEREVACAECAWKVRGSKNIFNFDGRLLCRTCVLKFGAVMAYDADNFWNNSHGLHLRNTAQTVPCLAEETLELYIRHSNKPVRVLRTALLRWQLVNKYDLVRNTAGLAIRGYSVCELQPGVYVSVRSNKAVVARGVLTDEYLLKKDAVLAQRSAIDSTWVTKEYAELLKKNQGFVEVRDLYYRSGDYRRERRIIPRDRAVQAFTTPNQTRRIWIENVERNIATVVGVGKETAVYARTRAVLEHRQYNRRSPLQPYRPDPTRWNFAKRRNEQEQAA